MANPQMLLDSNKLAGIQSTIPENFQDLFSNMMEMVRGVMGNALTSVFYIGALLLFVGVVLSLFLKNKSAVKDTVKEYKDEESAA